MKEVAFRVFRSQGFGDLQIEPTATVVAEFASSLSPNSLVNITHVLDGHVHVMTVWYWDDEKTVR